LFAIELRLNERGCDRPMKLLSRLFGSGDPREALRPLWHRVIELARERHWYAERGVADTIEGRFDMITVVLALLLLRMEREPELVPGSVYLTELFVEDMDGQLRESGIGDVSMGKHVGRLVSAMGGRLGAYREALAQPDDAALIEAVRRNVRLLEGADGAALAAGLRALAARFEPIAGDRLLAAEI
jgi:cytochrome b pre-mRNA-processing protein 3